MHQISIYLIRETELRDFKIQQILDSSTQKIPIFKRLNSGLVAFVDKPPKHYFKNFLIGHIWTDYFGGCGEQGGRLINKNSIIYEGTTIEDWSSYPINEILKRMGVESKDSKDEFDTIGLGSFRTNKDFNI